MVPPGLRVVQLIKANVSATDSTIGLTLIWAGPEPSRAHASRGCKNNRPMAITQIAIMRRDPFTLVISDLLCSVAQNAALSLNKGVKDGANQQARPTRISEPSSRFEAVDERLQEGNDVVFFLRRQAKLTNRHIFVVGVFRHRPTGHLLFGSLWTMPRQHVIGIDITRVVEVDYLLQAREIAVVHVSFHEVRARHHGRVARRRGLEFALELRKPPSPAQVRRSAIVAIQEQSHSKIDKPGAQWVAGKSPLIRSVLRIPGKFDILGEAEVVVRCVGEQRLKACRLAGIASAQESTRPSIQVTGIAAAFAAEQVIPVPLLCGEGCFSR